MRDVFNDRTNVSLILKFTTFSKSLIDGFGHVFPDSIENNNSVMYAVTGYSYTPVINRASILMPIAHPRYRKDADNYQAGHAAKR